MEGLTQPNQNPKLREEEKDEETGKLALLLAINVSLPMVLKSVIELNIFEIIAEAGANAFLSPVGIAAKLTTKNPNAPILLDRMLSLLASHSILKCSVQIGQDGEVLRSYGLGPISKFYLKNQGEGSFGPLLLLLQDKIFMQSWYHLNDAVLEGGVPFDRAYGMNAFEYPGKDQRFNQVFNQAMSNHTTSIMKKILDVYSGLEEVKILVDVGGGIGVNLGIITSKYPHIKGINYDLPHVVMDAPPHSGVEHVGGDMFESVPQGDAIVMKWILHDWSDNHCLKLLKNCYEALPDNGKVIIVESIIPESPENTVTANIVYLQDIFMLAQNPGGKERTQKEFNALAMKSGFASCEVICSAYSFWVMEFHKK